MSIEAFRYRCQDGASNQLNLIDNGSDTAILCIPAMGMRAAKYQNLLFSLSEQVGLSVASFDLRGNGASSARAARSKKPYSNFGYHELLELELPAAVDALKQRLQLGKIVLFGHSLGGQVAILGQAIDIKEIQGIVLSASCSVYYRGWPVPGRYGLFALSQLAALIARLMGYFPGRKLGFGNREAKTIMIDWARNCRSGEYRLVGSVRDFRVELKEQQIPILALNYQDDLFAPPSATQYLSNFLPLSPVTQITFSAKQLGLKKADHFSWLQSPDVPVGAVKNWLLEAQLLNPD